MTARVIVANEGLRAYLGPLLDPYDPPAFWEADDRIAALRAVGAEARVMVGIVPDQLWAMIDALPALEVILSAGAGYDGADPARLKARGIALCNSGDSNRDDVADSAVMLALALRRDLLGGDALVRGGGWARRAQAPTGSFADMKAGILGYGGIGQAIARRLDAFGLETRWWGPRAKPNAAHARAESLTALAGWCDLLIVALPAQADTGGLVDAGVIDALGTGGMIVNVGRGNAVDEDALIAALREGRLGGAGLDVFAEEPTPAERWADVPNIVFSPHRAGLTEGGRRRAQQVTAENIRRALVGEPLLNRIV